MGQSPQFNEHDELVRSLRKQLEAAELELARQKWVFERFLESPSWRLTFPLRWLARQARSLRRWISGVAAQESSNSPIPPREGSQQRLSWWPGEGRFPAPVHHNVALHTLLSSRIMLRLPESDAPEVSLILVYSGLAELTLSCLRSILGHSAQRLEVMIVDNASTKETPPLLKRITGGQVIRISKPLSVPSALNQAACQARGDYLLLLKDNVDLLPGALEFAIDVLRADSGVGAVCGRVIGFDGSLDEAGSILWNDGTSNAYGLGDHPHAPMYMFRRDVDYGSAAFLGTPRALWERVGGFDECFQDAYYEEDYGARLCENGLRTIYDPRIAVIRHESTIQANGKDAVLHRAQRERFTQKHAQFLADQWPPDVHSILKARARGRSARRVLFLDDRVPYPWLGCGLPRARAILMTMRKQGWFVTFYPLVIEDDDWFSVYSDMPLDVEFMLGFGRLALESFLRNRAGYYHTIFVSRPHNMAILRPICARNPDLFRGVNIVYDAEALFACRDIARKQLEGIPYPADEADGLIRDEVALAAAADVVISVSEYERAILQKFGIRNVHVLGHTLAVKPAELPFEQRQGFLFVGAIHEASSPNADSVAWFLTEIFPRIQADLGEDATVLIAGANNSARIRQLAGASVRITGLAKDLEPLYSSARVFIAPTRFAAGIPHKIHEAAAFGLPVVATPLLAAELGWQDGSLLAVGGNAESFAGKCIEVYTQKELWTRLRLAALKRVQRECSPESFEERVREILEFTGHCRAV